MPTNFAFPLDVPFTILQESQDGDGLTGVLPTVEAGTERRSRAYRVLAAGGIGGLFEFNSKWSFEIVRMTLDCPNDVTYSIRIVEEGVTTILQAGGPGVTDVVSTDKIPIMPSGQIQFVVSAPAVGTVTAKVTAIRSERRG
jgi:hypothetical protein